MASSDDSSLGGRLGRYAKVGGAVGGLATQFAVSKALGRTLDPAQHAGEIRAALGQLKGPLMKVAQILSTVPDLLPPEYSAELSQLQADAPPMGWPFVRRRMAGELGPEWRSRFAEFGQVAAAAASLGQVHRATAPDGRSLAVKLQYPDMGSAVEADLKQLGMLLGLFRRVDSTVELSDVQVELAARLREELDYGREARHIELFSHMLAGVAGIRLPEVLPELSTDRLLTMTWLDGAPLLEAVSETPGIRDRAAAFLFEAWYRPLLRYGIIHGDPHLGNYTVGEDGSLNLLDFGCVRVFRPRFVGGVVDLCRALETGDQALAKQAYAKWGFPDPSDALVGALNMWAAFLYGPLLDDRVRPISELASLIEHGRQTATVLHERLSAIGSVRVPREFVFMDRAAVGLGSVFTRLGAELNWSSMFRSLIDGFDEAALRERQAEALAAAGLSHDAEIDPLHA